MKDISTEYKTYLAGEETSETFCWKATLQDGTIITATAFDEDLVLPDDGLTYVSTVGVSPTAVDTGSNLAPDNLDVEGFLAAPGITSDDIVSGRWDYARIEFFAVNWADLTMGRRPLRTGTLGEVNGGRSKFRAELRGLTQAYSRPIVRLVLAECDAEFGDARCGKNPAPYTQIGTIDSVDTTTNRIINDAARTEPDEWYTNGKITFTSGLCNGLSMEVKRSYSSGQIELHQRMPFTINIGDTYSLRAGCMGRFEEDCVGKFNNGVNHRGFNDLPGAKIYERGGG